jgi:hypothetical protein
MPRFRLGATGAGEYHGVSAAAKPNTEATMKNGIPGALLPLLVFVSLGAGQDPAPPPKQTVPPLWSRIGLTREQKEKMREIQANYREKINELKRQIRALENQQRAELETLLTPAQKARLKELAAEREKEGKPDNKKASPEAEKPAEKKP